VRESVAALGLEHADSPTGHVTVSIDVASLLPRANTQADALIEAADGALYRAKAMGRNTTCSAASPEKMRARA
jgi:diguanylate cyclase (GGDEF)-like protein